MFLYVYRHTTNDNDDDDDDDGENGVKIDPLTVTQYLFKVCPP